MKLVWNNLSPNRTVDRPSVWELIRRNGTSRVIAANEIRALADLKADHGVKEVMNDLQPAFSPYFCF